MGKREGNSGGSSFEHTRGDAVRTRGGLAGKVRDEGDDVAFSAEEFSRTRVGERGGMGERGGAAELKHELKKEFRQ